MRRTLLIGLGLILAFAAFVYLNNTNQLSAPRPGKPTLLAHRGLHQTFPSEPPMGASPSSTTGGSTAAPTLRA
jgi:hypothetical protein